MVAAMVAAGLLCAASNAFAGTNTTPTVVTRAESTSDGSGGTVLVQLHCAAKANQFLAMDTTIDCWTTNGLHASVYNPAAEVATAHGAGTLPLEPFEICYVAQSLDVFHDWSPVASGCRPPGINAS